MGLRWQDGPERLAVRLRARGGRAVLPACDAAATEINAARLDVAHDVHGGIARSHAWLQNCSSYRDERDGPSPGQAEPITAVAQRHPHRTDGAFVRDNLHRWLS